MLTCLNWLAEEFLAGQGFTFEIRDGRRYAVRDHLAYPVAGPCTCPDCPPHQTALPAAVGPARAA